MEKIKLDSVIQEQEVEVKEITINGQTIEVKQYLPIDEKLDLISFVLENVAKNTYPFANPVQMATYTTLGIINTYTNIDISEEIDSAPGEVFDKIHIAGLDEEILKAIPSVEVSALTKGTREIVEAYYAYRNSAKGIIEDITTDYSNLNLDATAIQEKIADPNNLTLLKTVVDKLG